MTDTTCFADAGHTSIETALRQLLEAAQTTTNDPTGTYTVPARGPDKPAYTVAITAQPTADDSGHTTASKVSYCLDCEWRVSTADYPRAEVNSRLVTHAVETGHDIESADRAAASGIDST